MIEVSHLTKRYGEKYALNDVSFSVTRGEILGFLGPNGAGKSTTMNILTGYLSASSGTAKICGHDILEEPMEAKKHIGYLPELPPLYMDMTVAEYLDSMYDLKKCTQPREEHIKEICSVVKINHVYGRIIKHLSKGYRQRVGVAQALLGNPEVLILDEPTVGLDPQQIIEIRNLIKGLSKKHTVILSSHILTEVQAVCDRVIVINKGQMIADNTPDKLAHDLSNDHSLMIRIKGKEADALRTLKAVPGVTKVVNLGEKSEGVFEFSIDTKDDVDVRVDMFRRLAERDLPIMALRSAELTLEEIFLKLVNEQEENESKKGGRK